MHQFDKINKYSSLVCEQVRWKKAHNIISSEIENHIIDQANALIESGLDEENAIDKAITEMGDPISIGSQFDQTYKPKAEWSMIILTIFSLVIGLIINFFIKGNLADMPELYYFYRSIIVAIIGIICMIIAYFMDFTIMAQHSKKLFVLIIISMILLYPFSIEVNGAKTWFFIPLLGSVSASIFILFLPTIYAGIIYKMRNKGYLGIVLCCIFYAIPAFISLSMNYGLTIVFLYTLSCLILLIISILKDWFNVKHMYGLLFTIALILLISIIFLLPMSASAFRLSRFEAWLNPYNDPNGYGYIPIVIRNILSGAIFFGQGTLTSNLTNYGFPLTSANTDYVITYLIYRIGWISFISILVVLIAFIARGFYICSNQKSVLGRLVSTSVLLTFTIQVIVYISANLGFQPFHQLTLPLISYGGISTIANLILIGIMLSVFKSGHLMPHEQNVTDFSTNKLFKFIDGKIIIDLGFK